MTQTSIPWPKRPKEVPYDVTSAILVAQVREAPDVGEVYGEADDGQEEVSLLPPVFPLLLPRRPDGRARRRQLLLPSIVRLSTSGLQQRVWKHRRSVT